MKVFVYTYGHTIYMVFAENRQQADEQIKEETEGDLDQVQCTEYGEPNTPGSYIIQA